jgi:hypothetical protein
MNVAFDFSALDVFQVIRRAEQKTQVTACFRNKRLSF